MQAKPFKNRCCLSFTLVKNKYGLNLGQKYLDIRVCSCEMLKVIAKVFLKSKISKIGSLKKEHFSFIRTVFEEFVSFLTNRNEIRSHNACSEFLLVIVSLHEYYVRSKHVVFFWHYIIPRLLAVTSFSLRIK